MSASASTKALKISTRLSPSARAKIGNEIEMAVTGAPAAAFSIPDSVRYDAFIIDSDRTFFGPKCSSSYRTKKERTELPGAAVRSIGTSRRIFLLKPTLTPTEIEGLAYRIRALSSSDAINSFVVANPMEDADGDGDLINNETCLSAYFEDDQKKPPKGPFGRLVMKSVLHEEFGESLHLPIPHVSSGYDARSIFNTGMSNDPTRLERELMLPLKGLSVAARGSYDETLDVSESKVPMITVPNGLVADSGYSFLMGSYVLATYSTSFRILNPLRGLAFDPIGLSYTLPRLGWEFNQASANYSLGCGMLLALGGYDANGMDMVSTGLATHYIGSPFKLNVLERGLADIDSYAAQNIRENPKKMFGHEDAKMIDLNEQYKNVAVGNLVQHVSEYDVVGAGEYGPEISDLDEDGLHLRDKDPSLTLEEERFKIYGEIDSMLVNLSATFDNVWEERTVEGVMERLREIAATAKEFEGKSGFEEDVKVAQVAQELVTNMEKRSPLAMCVMHRLLLEGCGDEETLDSCMEREQRSQIRLFTKEDGDFVRWAKSGKGVGLTEVQGHSLLKEKHGTFKDWNHSSVKEVTEDEIEEIVSN